MEVKIYQNVLNHINTQKIKKFMINIYTWTFALFILLYFYRIIKYNYITLLVHQQVIKKLFKLAYEQYQFA
jgi:hypothetical protein